MKINGVKLEGRHVEDIFIPRGEVDGVLFKASAIQDLEYFDEKCTEPKPPYIHRPGKAPQPDFESKSYKDALSEHNKRRLGYMMMETLKDTPDLEWEILNTEDPATWSRYEEEFKQSGFTQMEINQILGGVMRVNSLDQEHIKQARERFLAMKAEAERAEQT
jgi:hypothetical protein